jgi:hypothetical protein
MYHFETVNKKTNKSVILEDSDLNILLKKILQLKNTDDKDNDESEVIFEDSVNNKLLGISEKYLKVALGIEKMRKNTKLDKALNDFKKLDINNVSIVNFENKIHTGIISIWENETNIENDSKNNSENDSIISEDSDIESIHMESKNDEIKILQEENKKLKEQIKLLKSFVTKYRDMCINLNNDAKNLVKI